MADASVKGLPHHNWQVDGLAVFGSTLNNEPSRMGAVRNAQIIRLKHIPGHFDV
jgi:hypothetical protein